MDRMHLSLDPLRTAMARGGFEKAVTLLQQSSGKRVQEADFVDWCQEVAEQLTQQGLWEPSRMEPAVLGAEFLYYIGQDKAAERFIGAYAQEYPKLWELDDTGPGTDITLRLALQIGQYYYGHRDFEKASAIGAQISAWCQEHQHYFGVGLGYHLMARAAARRDEFLRAEYYCDQAITALARAGTAPDRPSLRSLVWRLGVVWLTEGHIAWLTGDLHNGERKLYVAQFFLHKTQDFINRANVNHSLGCILHARGQYPEAEQAFRSAEKGYCYVGQHRLHLSRLYLHLGRTYYDAGRLQEAEDCFKQSKDMAISIENRRQHALSEISLSLLYGHESFAQHCLQKAHEYLNKGQKIINQLQNNRRSRLRAHFAWGIYLTRRHEYEQAEKRFGRAIEQAKELQVPQDHAQACLLLADLYCSKPVVDIQKATLYCEHAKDALRTGNILERDTPYALTCQIAAIEEKIFALQTRILVFTPDDIASQKGIKKIEKEIRKWAIETALNMAGERSVKAAKLLGLSRPAFDKARKQIEAPRPAAMRERPI